MIAKTIIKDVKPQYINNSLNMLQSRVDNVLNKELYMADIEGTYAALLTYYNLLANKLGKVTVSYTSTSAHSGKVFISKVPKSLTIPNINETFRLVDASFEGFISLILSDYSKMYGRYSNTVSNVYGSSSSDGDSGMLADASSYTNDVRAETQAIIDEIIETETATSTEIQQGLDDARTEAGATVEDAAEEAAAGFDDAWDKAGGHETTEDMIEKAQEAIENARNEAAKAAENARNQENSERAHNATQDAKDAWDKAVEEYQQAIENRDKATAELDQAVEDFGKATATSEAIDSIIIGSGGFDTTTGHFVEGTYTDERAGGAIIEYTVSIDEETGKVSIESTITYPDGTTYTGDTKSGIDNSADGLTRANAEAEEAESAAKQNSTDAFDNAGKATTAEADAMAKAVDAKTEYDEAVKAAQEADDANIANATSEELETGWYNDSGSEGVAETDQGIVDDFNDMFDDADGDE